MSGDDLLYEAMALLANAEPYVTGQFLVSGDGLANGSPDDHREALGAGIAQWLTSYNAHLREQARWEREDG